MTMFNVPKVIAPMDFGIEYLESTSHGNLRFLLQDDEELFANSAIMSFNSPVIKKMTIEDGRTTVDAQDFSKDAMQCFLKSAYSGKLNSISKSLFRDVNKIAHVFEVIWLKGKCYEYFQSLTAEAAQNNEYGDQLYVFNEAMYILDKLKKRSYIDDFIQKFKPRTSCTEKFVTEYLSDISTCSAKNLEVIMEMTKDHEYILVKVLVRNLEMKNASLNENSRRILRKLNIITCPPRHESLYQKLLQKLEEIENPSTEDFRLIIKILRQSKLASPYTSGPGNADTFSTASQNSQFDGPEQVLFDDEDEEDVWIPEEKCGRVIGRGGSKVHEIQDESGANVQVFGRETADNGRVKVTFRGSAKQPAKSKPIIRRRTECKRSGGGFGGGFSTHAADSLEMWVPTFLIGRIVGRGGTRIRVIQDQFSVRVNIKKDEIRDCDTKVILSGSPSSTRQAEDYINELCGRRSSTVDFDSGAGGSVSWGRTTTDFSGWRATRSLNWGQPSSSDKFGWDASGDELW